MSFGVDPRNPIEYAGLRYFVMPCVNYNREPESGLGGDYDFPLNTIWRVSSSPDGVPPVSGEPGDQWILVNKSGSYAQANTNPTWEKFAPGQESNLFTLSNGDDEIVTPSSAYDAIPNNIQFYSPNGTVTITAEEHRMGFDLEGGIGAIQQITTDQGVLLPTGDPNNVYILGSVAENGQNSKPVFTEVLDSGVGQVEVQLTTAVTPTPNNFDNVGLACFNANQFQVDATSGQVSLIGDLTAAALRSLSDDIDVETDPDSLGKIQIKGKVYRSPFALTLWSTTVSQPSTQDMYVNPMSSHRLIVDPLSFQNLVQWNGTANSILAAIAQAGTNDTVMLMPSTYSDNFTMKPGVCLTAANSNGGPSAAVINGQVTIPTTGTSTCVFTNIQFTTPPGQSSVIIAGTGICRVIFNNCQFNVATGQGISFTNTNSSSMVVLNSCSANITGTGVSLYDMSCPGQLVINGMTIENDGGTLTPMSNSAGTVKLYDVRTKASVSSSGGVIDPMVDCYIDTSAINDIGLEVQNNGTVVSYGCVVKGGTASAIDITAGSTLQLTNATVSSSNGNAISGSGTLNKSPIIYTGSSSTVQGTITVNSFTVT